MPHWSDRVTELEFRMIRDTLSFVRINKLNTMLRSEARDILLEFGLTEEEAEREIDVALGTINK